MRRRTWIACVMALLAPAVALNGAETLRIVPLVGGDSVLVSFELSDAYTDEVRQAIGSGLRATFTYDVDLRMMVPAWADRTIASVVVSMSDHYDNLTRRHSLSRAIDGRVQESIVTEDEQVVRKWLTMATRLPLCRTSRLDPSRDYYVRISARSRPQGGSLLGWASAITGQAKFTFIP